MFTKSLFVKRSATSTKVAEYANATGLLNEEDRKELYRLIPCVYTYLQSFVYMLPPKLCLRLGLLMLIKFTNLL